MGKPKNKKTPPASGDIPQDVEAFLREFKKKTGRRPRVLHIGNIANNAYLNAKILNEVGFDCDVCCHDYYHVMGHPEWEDAKFEGKVEDPFKPDWSAFDLNGFQRPFWFAQGKMQTVLDYLTARRRGHSRRAGKLWHILSRQSCFQDRRFRSRSSRLLVKLHLFVRVSIQVVQKILPFLSLMVLLFCLYEQSFLLAILALATCLANLILYRDIGRNIVIQSANVLSPLLQARVPLWIGMAWGLGVAGLGLFNLVDQKWLWGSVGLLLMQFVWELARKSLIPFYDRLVAAENQIVRNPQIPHSLSLQFPTKEQLVGHLAVLSRWLQVFELYDYVVAYADMGIWPFLAGKKYTAYSHGTIRELPYKSSLQGRICALAYSQASSIYVTNLDCMDSAAKLALSPDRIIYGIHGFDDRRIFHELKNPSDVNFDGRLGVEKDKVLFLAPARHQWRTGEKNMRKGNDLYIRAAVKLKRKYPNRFVIVAMDWGEDIAASRELADSLGVNDHIKWVPPLSRRQLWHAIYNADVVIDQFIVQGIGGVGVDSFCIGKPIITNMIPEMIERFFGQAPPFFPAKSSEEIFAAMDRLIESPSLRAEYSSGSYQWAQRYHNRNTILSTMIRSFSKQADEQ